MSCYKIVSGTCIAYSYANVSENIQLHWREVLNLNTCHSKHEGETDLY